MIIIIVLDRNSLGNKKDYHSFKKQQQLRGGGCFLSEQISIIKLCLWDHGQLNGICFHLYITTKVYLHCVPSSKNLEILVLPTMEC